MNWMTWRVLTSCQKWNKTYVNRAVIVEATPWLYTKNDFVYLRFFEANWKSYFCIAVDPHTLYFSKTGLLTLQSALKKLRDLLSFSQFVNLNSKLQYNALRWISWEQELYIDCGNNLSIDVKCSAYVWI